MITNIQLKRGFRMSKSLYDFSKMPNISEELSPHFAEIINSGIEVFAKENDMSLDEATALFERKLHSVTIRTFDEKNITRNSPREEQELLFKSGLTQCKVDPEKPNEPVIKTININNYLLEDPNELKSTLIHEIFHAVLSDDKLTFRNGQYVHNMGCSETLFEDGKHVGTTGHMMHEALVARMQKNFCKKEGIKFEEKGLFSSAYVEELKRLQKFEKLTGVRISPRNTLSQLKLIHGQEIESFATSLDTHDYSKCDDILLQIQNQKSPISRAYHKFLDFAKHTGEKVKTIFKGKQPLMLEEGSKEHANILTPEGHSLTSLEHLSPEKPPMSKEEAFRNSVSENGLLRKLPPLDMTRYTSSHSLQQENEQASSSSQHEESSGEHTF